MPKRHIRMISAAVAVAIPLGAAVCGAVAVPSAQAQTVAVSQAKGTSAIPFVGVGLYVDKNYPLADVKAWGARDLKYIHGTLGLKAVQINWDYNIPGLHANVVQDSRAETPTIADLAALTSIARSYRMRIEYRVLFAINSTNLRSRSIVPRNFRAWLASLLSVETPALRLAAQEHVSEFIAGTEMASIDDSPLWAGFFRKAAKLYRGILSYAQWGGRHGTLGLFIRHGQPLPIPYLGATAYPPVNLAPSATVAALTKAWKSFLTQYQPESVLRRTALDEVGIPALSGAYKDPWQWIEPKGAADPTVQARWFTAACDAVHAEHLRGIYFWSMALNDNPAHPFRSKVGYLGRPASLNAIKSC